MLAEQFPDFNRTDPRGGFSIEARTLKRMLDKVAFCMAVEDVRHCLKGALLDPTETGLTAISSDGHRFALCESAIESVGSKLHPAIVLREAVLMLAKQLPASADPIRVELHDSTLSVTLPGLVASVKLIEARYPNWQRAMLKDFPIAVSLDCGTAAAAFRRASLAKNDKVKAVKVALARSELTITATNENGEISEDGPAVDSPDELELGINAVYVTEALGHMDGQTATLKLTDPNDPSYWFVIMPMRL